MNLTHVTAHLGGGVGKAHAALSAVMPADIKQTFLLLEEPRDRRYADEIIGLGAEVVVARDFADMAARLAEADIVQFEFWNHPKLFECLARVDFPAMRSVFWSHVSGLFRPVIAGGFYQATDRFVFTTPASMVLGEGMAAETGSRLSVIGSGFGFEPSPSSESKDHPQHPIAYLGTVDFIKMHPGFFEAIDGLPINATAAIWGGYDPSGDVAAKARSMHHPDRIHFMGQTADPKAALQKSNIFFYPLQPDHYGTAENALIEAMSLGLVPVVLANPAECAIVEHGTTGFVGKSIAVCRDLLEMLLASPEKTREIGANAAKRAAENHNPIRSADQFVTLWSSLLQQPKHRHDFATATGATPLDWYRTTQGMSGDVLSEAGAGLQSKGTLAHFKSAFPGDPCWDHI